MLPKTVQMKETRWPRLIVMGTLEKYTGQIDFINHLSQGLSHVLTFIG